MKKQILYFFIMVILLVNIFTLFRLNSFKNSVDNCFQQNQAAESNRNNEINNIYSNVETMLKKQASILDNYNVTFGTLDSNNFTVPITLSITPKEYSNGLTASFQINDKNITMKKNGASFTAAADVYIFNDFQLKVILSRNGIQRIETLEEYCDLQSKYLLNITGGFRGGSSYGSGKFQCDGEINLDFAGSEENRPEKVSIAKDVNGTIVYEQQIDLSDHILLPVNEKIALRAGDKLTIYAHVQDKYGLNYKYIILTYEIDSKGEPLKDDELNIRRVVEISNKNGIILNTPKFDIK